MIKIIDYLILPNYDQDIYYLNLPNYDMHSQLSQLTLLW